MIKTTKAGLHMTFENGFTISVQFGAGNYSSNRSMRISDMFEGKVPPAVSVEIAIWDKNNDWFNFGSDEVKGWVSTEDLPLWFTVTKQATNLAHLKTLIELTELN
jgi:hypothetical protein